MGGRKILDLGLVWVIGRGDYVKIWKDPWLFGQENPWVQTERNVAATVEYVQELMDKNGGWNLPLINSIFNQTEARCIFSLPFSREREDCITWKLEKSGVYSAKTGYAEWMRVHDRAYGQISAIESKKWKWVWELDITPKVKLFIWRILRGIVPSTVNLITHHVNIEPRCSRCDDPIETTEHVLRDCTTLTEFWSLLPFTINGVGSTIAMEDWVLGCCRALKEDEQQLLVTAVWFCWFARNECLFNQTQITGSKLMEYVTKHVMDYRKSVMARPRCDRRFSQCSWQPPPPNLLKLNTDVSCRGGCGVGIGGVVRNSIGGVVWMVAWRVGSLMSVEVAEACAVRDCMRRAIQNGCMELIVEMDSQIVFSALTRPKHDLSYFGGIFIAEILAFCSSFTHIEFCWVRRSANCVAHCLASFTFTCTDLFFSASVPAELLDVVNTDISGI